MTNPTTRLVQFGDDERVGVPVVTEVPVGPDGLPPQFLYLDEVNWIPAIAGVMYGRGQKPGLEADPWMYHRLDVDPWTPRQMG